MKKTSWVATMSGVAICAASMLVVSSAVAAPSDPVEMIYNFQATGTFDSFDPATGKSTYLISAVGRAPSVRDNGIIRPPRKDDRDDRGGRGDDDDDDYKVILTDAAITFDGFDPATASVVNFSCEGCKLTYPDGSVLTSDPNVPLQGRALFLYGPVAPDPSNPIMTIRMAGWSARNGGARQTGQQGRFDLLQRRVQL